MAADIAAVRVLCEIPFEEAMVARLCTFDPAPGSVTP